nr:prepilin peptidase [Paracoccus saliphilus]
MNFLTIWVYFYPIIMIHAGIGDLRTMRIPNRLILLLLAGYTVAVPLFGLTLPELFFSFAAAAIVFALGFLAFSCRWMGGGDVKLLTVATLWLGAGNVVTFIFYTSIFGAILTISLLIFRAARLPVPWRGPQWISALHRRDCGVPYGVAIAAAAVLVYLRTPWVAAQF